MKNKLFITIGLPGSGKSTWGESFIKEYRSKICIKVEPNENSILEILDRSEFPTMQEAIDFADNNKDWYALCDFSDEIISIDNMQIGLYIKWHNRKNDNVEEWNELFMKTRDIIFIQNPIVEINRDDIRFAVFKSYITTPEEESGVSKIQDKYVKKAISNKQSIIISDTNLKPWVQEKWGKIAEENGYEFVKKDYTSANFEDCVQKDLHRMRTVGKDILMWMYRTYIRPYLYKHTRNPSKIDSIICDISGTLTEDSDDKNILSEKPNIDIFHLLLLYSKQYRIILLTGRYASTRNQVIEWLDKQIAKISKNTESFGTINPMLFMKEDGNGKPDFLYKKEVFMDHIDSRFNVCLALDDKDSVIRMYRDLGLTALQVADGSKDGK